ncbi:MAG: delta-60 repeat domain-containing protein [Candidatus Nanopelagicales bacterium]
MANLSRALRKTTTLALATGLAFAGITLGSPTLSQATTGAPGTLDPSFNTGTGFAGNPSAPSVITMQSDGKIVVGGFFSGYQGEAASGIVRLNSDGSRDTAFDLGGAGVDGSVEAIVQQPDGKLLIGGAFTTYQGDPHPDLVRVLPDGTPDPTFSLGSGFTDQVSALALAPNGEIYVSGFFQGFDGTNTGGLVRLNSDGSRDTSFNPGSTNFGGLAPIFAMQIQSDGKLVVGGEFTTVDSMTVGNIARLNTDGSLDTGFAAGAGANGNVYGITNQPDQKLIVTGEFTQFTGQPYASLVRLSSNGAVDSSFAPGGIALGAQVNRAAVQPNGKVVVVGNFESYLGSPNGIAQFNPNGTLDTGFNPGGSGFAGGVNSLALQSNGSIMAGGFVDSYNGEPVNNVARLFGGPVLIQQPTKNCVVLGKTKKLPLRGTKKLMKPQCTSNAGNRIGVNASAKLRGDIRSFRLYCQVTKKKTAKTIGSNGTRICRKGSLKVRTYGQRITLRVTWSAPTTATHTPYTQTKTFRSR